MSWPAPGASWLEYERAAHWYGCALVQLSLNLDAGKIALVERRIAELLDEARRRAPHRSAVELDELRAAAGLPHGPIPSYPRSVPAVYDSEPCDPPKP